MNILKTLITKIQNSINTNKPQQKLIRSKEKSSIKFPSHTQTSFKLNNDNEHFLDMIKINFDSRYSPDEYKIDTDVMPTEKDKENGRIVLIWWINKNNILKKFPPSYFYFRYGLYIDEEIRYLNEIGWLNQFIITELGTSKLKNNNEIIDEHRFLSKENKQSILNHQATINHLADFFNDVEFDLTHITLNSWATNDGIYSEEQLNEGFQYLEVAKVLTKQKKYEKSLKAVAKSWSLGYQAHDTWMRGAIDARYLKDRKLEESILLMGIKWAKLSNVPTDDFDKRLKRVHELMARELV